MQTIVLAALLAAVFAFFVQSLQARLRAVFQRMPATIWLVPALLTALFSAAAVLARTFSAALALLALVYTAAPAACVYTSGPGPAARPAVLDCLAVLLLWLPLEFAAGARLVARPAQGFLHSVAYGIAILLGLTLFLAFRAMPTMKCSPPRTRRDLWLPLAGFALSAPILVAVGIAIGFIPPPHLPGQPAGRMAAALGSIFAGTALPEEILFRSLIQNFLMQRFGSSTRVLIAASLIFGAAHLDNGPQPLPNWRYMILATIAGVAYGKVFERSSTLLSSAALHTLVDWTKHFFF